MNKSFIKSSLIWGFILWLIGYLLGIVLFAIVRPPLLGWTIMPIGILVTIWVLLKKINFHVKEEAIFMGVSWSIIAIVCDYLFLVLVFKPIGGYYKLDVYLYYIITFILPIIVGRLKNHR